jgi:hypothetical protein
MARTRGSSAGGFSRGASRERLPRRYRVIGFDVEGYGHLIAAASAGARALQEPGALGACRAVCLPEPDLNVTTWLVTHRRCTSLAEVNALNGGIAAAMRPDVRRDPPYMLTSTRLSAPGCDGIARPLLAELGAGEADWPSEGLVVLRSTVMDPYFVAGPPTPDHLHGLVGAVRDAAAEVLGLDGAG